MTLAMPSIRYRARVLREPLELLKLAPNWSFQWQKMQLMAHAFCMQAAQCMFSSNLIGTFEHPETGSRVGAKKSQTENHRI